MVGVVEVVAVVAATVIVVAVVEVGVGAGFEPAGIVVAAVALALAFVKQLVVQARRVESESVVVGPKASLKRQERLAWQHDDYLFAVLGWVPIVSTTPRG